MVVAVAVYFGTLDHTFHFDDKQNVWNNLNIQISNFSFNEQIKAGFEGNLNQRPMANISFALNY